MVTHTHSNISNRMFPRGHKFLERNKQTPRPLMWEHGDEYQEYEKSALILSAEDHSMPIANNRPLSYKQQPKQLQQDRFNSHPIATKQTTNTPTLTHVIVVLNVWSKCASKIVTQINSNKAPDNNASKHTHTVRETKMTRDLSKVFFKIVPQTTAYTHTESKSQRNMASAQCNSRKKQTTDSITK